MTSRPMTTFFAPLRYNRTLRHSLLAVLLFFVLLLLTGCGPNVNDNPTPVNLFPTAIPNGSPPPTFISFQLSPTPGGPTLPPQPSQPTLVPATATPAPPTAIPTLDANWSTVGSAIQYRRLSFRNSQGQDVSVLVARIDPTKATFKVKYTPGNPRGINDWALALPGASLIINGNYFDKSNNSIGLVATDGNLFGSSVGRNDSGLFQVIGDSARVR